MKAILRDQNSASVNDVYIYIFRTYNKITQPTTSSTSRLLQSANISERILETSNYGTVYLSDNNIDSTGEAKMFNWLFFIVIPVAGLLTIIVIIVLIVCCCKKSKDAAPKKPTKKKPITATGPSQIEREDLNAPQNNNATPKIATRDIRQPMYVPSDRSIGGKHMPLESHRSIPKTQDNSYMGGSDNDISRGMTPERTPERSPEKVPLKKPEKKIPEKSKDVSPDRTPDRSRDTSFTRKIRRKERDISPGNVSREDRRKARDVSPSNMSRENRRNKRTYNE